MECASEVNRTCPSSPDSSHHATAEWYWNTVAPL
jgi:hypothetical protein